VKFWNACSIEAKLDVSPGFEMQSSSQLSKDFGGLRVKEGSSCNGEVWVAGMVVQRYQRARTM